MTFAEFQIRRQQLRAERRTLIDCAETNLYASLEKLIPPPTPTPTQTVHRCHLATEWAVRFDLPPDVAKRALISCGVRDSLERLFTHYARQSATVWLPSDNYPVFWELARAAGLQPRAFRTLPAPEWPSLPPASGDEILLVTNPLKPLGRHLEPAEVSALKTWLAASPRRRLVLDTVYTFATTFHGTTLQLVATGQTILLHSLTKGWLQPRLFGTALVPEIDLSALAPAFREQPPPQTNLARARAMLADHPNLPADLHPILEVARMSMLLKLIPRDIFPQTPEPGFYTYFFPVFGPWEELLKKHNLLGLPASVFGSANEDFTILSSLSFIQDPLPE